MLDKNKILELAKDYFKAFESKDLNRLADLFDDHIILYDPVVKEIKSKEGVLMANKIIFDNATEIKFLFKRLFVDHFSNTCMAELKIHFDGNLIEVVDILEYSETGKITKITAYLDTGSH